MADAISIQELIDARTDAKTLEEAVNGDAVTTVLSRLGESYPTLANALSQIDGKLDSADAQIKQAITDLFQNGGLPATPFATKALMESSELVDGDYAMVTEDTVNNGLYAKTAGNWVKSDYDPLQKSKEYTDNKVKGVTNNFKTKALMTASTLPNESYAMVIEDTEANNGLYVKTAGAWIKSDYDPFEASKNHFKESYLKQSTNLLMLDNFEEGFRNKSLNRSTGALLASDTYSVHPFIEVEPSSQYRLSGLSKYAVIGIGEYDSDKNFKKFTLTPLNTEGYLVITMSANTYYIRPQVGNSAYTLDNKPMLSEGASVKEYEVGKHPELVNIYYDNGLDESDVTSILDAKAGTAIKFADNNIEMPVNLFVKENVLFGKRIDNATGEVLDSSSSHYFVTEYIPVKPNTVYTATAEGSQTTAAGFFNFIYYYDKDKNYISYATFNSEVSVPISRTTPKTAAYVLISSIYPVDRVERTFVEGSDTTHRPRTNALLYNVDMEEGFFDEVYSEVYSRVHYLLSKPFYYDTDFSKTYTIDRDLTKYAPYAQKTSAEVYAEFDLLMANSNGYITKERLSDSVLGEEISAYTFNPPTYIGVGDQTGDIDQRPTVLIMCGTHGHENLPIFTAYAFANEICNEWLNDDMLAALRFNVRFIIVPIANPDAWGYNPVIEGVTRGRKNANGVDIARNFPSSYWGAYPDPNSKTYSGPSAGSEIETQNIIGLFERNKIDIFYDFHNFQERSAESGTGTMTWLLYHPVVNRERTANTLRAYFSKHTRLMHKQVAMPPNWTAGRGQTYYYGTPMEYGAEAGAILSTTLEINRAIPYSEQYSETLHENFDAMHSKVTFEAFINWVTTCVDEIGSRF